MDREVFKEKLIQSAESVIQFSRQYLTNTLPDHCLYLLFPNMSYDGNPLIEDEETFPEDSLARDSYLGPFNADGVVDFLWRNGKIPEWIDINPHSVDGSYTYLRLLCCGRFTARDLLLYYHSQGTGPFHTCGPYLPPGWNDIETSGKFDLHWPSWLKKGTW